MNKQIEFWKGDFGKEYTDRSVYSPEVLDQLYVEHLYGISRTSLNKGFLTDIAIDRILEAGCNVGNQLRILQQMGYENLYGIELQAYAVEKAKSITRNINIIQGNLLNNPFRDGFFDLVYTAGVLIHIAPENIKQAMQEIYRTSGRYIWGCEYYSEEYQQVDYRGNENALWKGNFLQMYLDEFPDLRVVKERKLPILNSGNVDIMFLLEKSS